MDGFDWLRQFCDATRELEPTGARQMGDLILFPPIDLVNFLVEDCVSAVNLLNDADISNSFIASYPKESLKLLHKIAQSIDLADFYRFSNGMRHVHRHVSVFGIWTNSAARRMWKCTDLLASNILEKQLNRSDGEIYLGTCSGGDIQVFLAASGDKLLLRRATTTELIDEYATLDSLLSAMLNPRE